MVSNSFGISLTYASVDRGDGSDPRDAARQILRDLRVPASLRDAGATWREEDSEAVIAIPMSDEGRVLTLTDADAVDASLTPRALREVFADRGLTLWLDDDDDDDNAEDGDDAVGDDGHDAAETEGEQEDGDLEDALAGDDIDPDLFEPQPVRVAAFSHRGPASARIAAELNRTRVEHVESGTWSVQLFESSDPTSGVSPSKAEAPIIEWNRPVDGGAWFEVSTSRGVFPIPFWTDAERDTQPVLDLADISVPETVEIYRRLLTEGDGSRDELIDLRRQIPVDVDAAHRALMPEALGGVAGVEAREREFLLAFGIPAELIDAAVSDDAVPSTQSFEPVGWGAAVKETVIAGIAEWAPLTKRQTPVQRFTRWIAKRPLLGIAFGVAEFTGGLWAASRFRGGGRAVGILFMIDAIGDLVVWLTRLRRGR